MTAVQQLPPCRLSEIALIIAGSGLNTLIYAAWRISSIVSIVLFSDVLLIKNIILVQLISSHLISLLSSCYLILLHIVTAHHRRCLQ